MFPPPEAILILFCTICFGMMKQKIINFEEEKK